jgi:peptidyl-prolyl cis-trans isomerase C
MHYIKRSGLLLVLLSGSIAISACNDSSDKRADTRAVTGNSAASLPGDKVVAIVDGTPIGDQLLDAYVQQRNASLPAQRDKADRAQVLEELINFELVIQDALRKNIDKTPDVATQLALQRRNVLASAAFREYLRSNPLTDEEMRADYESRMERLTLREYKLRHILSNDQAAAEKLITELAESDQDFAALAKKHSTGQSAEQGGDLGWLSPHDMLPEFKAAVEDLQKGQTTPAPVKTRFGWHVIYVEDTRESPPPPYEQVRDRVADVLKRRQIEDYIASLREKAKVDITLEEQAAEPAPATPPAVKQPQPAPNDSGNPLQDTLKGY